MGGNFTIAGGVILAGKIHLALFEQRADDLQCFFKAVNPMVEGEAKSIVFGLVPTGANAQDQPSAADFVHGVGHFSQQRRVAE